MSSSLSSLATLASMEGAGNPPERLIPASVAAYIWRGNKMGIRSTPVVASGFRTLDSQLPGGGWPCHSLTEIMSQPGAHSEWRLLASSIRRIQKRGGTVFVLGTPQTPHVPGLQLMGIDERRLVWVRVETARDRLWATQQIIQSGQAGAVMAWLPQTDSRALRRLQACAQNCEAPVFVMRPSAARHDTSPAPLRVEVSLCNEAWNLRLRVLKRRGPQLDTPIELPSIPGGLTQVLARRAAATGATRTAPAHASAHIPAHAAARAPTHVPAASIPFLRPVPSMDPATSAEPLDELLAGAVLPTPLRAFAG